MIAEATRTAIAFWEMDDWDDMQVKRGVALFLEQIGRGLSPREAFRMTNLGLYGPLMRYGKMRNRIQDRLRLCQGTHALISRLAVEYGDSYTSFVRAIVEDWAARYRELWQERPEHDLHFDPEWEGDDR